MFINILILYTHFVKRVFSTYCIARAWYDLCPKKKEKKKKKKKKDEREKNIKKRKKVVEHGRL